VDLAAVMNETSHIPGSIGEKVGFLHSVIILSAYLFHGSSMLIVFLALLSAPAISELLEAQPN
jgi:hypothetical protein